MALLDGILDNLRAYAAQRDGITPMASRFGAMSAPSATDINAPMLGDDSSMFVPGAEGMPMPSMASDPYASADAALAAKRRATMPNQSALPFAGMLAGANGGIGAQTGALDPGAFTPAMVQAQNTSPDIWSGTNGAAGPVPFAARSNVLASSAMPQPGDTTTISARPVPRAAAPAVASPAASAPAGPAAPNNPPGASFLERLSNGLAMHPNMLMALGAGLSGAPTFGQGMSRAFAAAIPAGKQDIAQNMQMQGIQETYKALVAQGVPPQEALAGVYNPEVMKQIVPRYFGGAHWGVIGYDPDTGMARYGMINENLQTVTPGNQLAVPTVKTPEDVIRLPKGQRFTWNGHIYTR